MNREQKIQKIIGLMAGQYGPEDIGPKMVINFNTEEGDIYLINNERVDKKTFDKLLLSLPHFYTRFECYGRPGDDGPTPDEYYAG